MSPSPDRDSVSCSHEAARLLPWFVVGALSERETARVQEHLSACPLCAADWEREQQVQSLIFNAPNVEYAPQPGLQKLMSRIDEIERELPAAPHAEHGMPRPQRHSTAIRWLAAAVIVQAIGLGVLGTLFWQRGIELNAPRFHTMSAVEAGGGSMASVRVVFAPAMSVSEMQRLLESIPAKLVRGPSEAGVYTLALENERSTVDEALTKLREHKDVMFAEPAAAALGQSP